MMEVEGLTICPKHTQKHGKADKTVSKFKLNLTIFIWSLVSATIPPAGKPVIGVDLSAAGGNVV